MTDLTPLEKRLERLEALEEMRALAHGYCHGLDKHDRDSFLAVFAQDAVWDLGEAKPQGPEEIGAMLEGIWGGFPETHHWTSNQVVDWSGDHPRGTCDVDATVRDAAGSWHRASATYVDDYVRVDGRWLIATRTATTHFTEPIA